MASHEPPAFEPRRAPGARGRSRTSRQWAADHRVRTRHPRSGGASWKAGTEGDDEVAELIDRAGAKLVALHDRTVHGRRLDFDHLVVAQTGVWVVHTELCRGRVELGQNPFGHTTLLLGGRDRIDLVAGLHAQLGLVATTVAAVEPAAQVRGALCLVTPKGLLVDSVLPSLRPIVVRDIPLLTPQRLVQGLLADGLLTAADRTRIARALAARFPAHVTR